MIGGTVLEVKSMVEPESKRTLVRIWVVEQRPASQPGKELAVFVEPDKHLPKFGDTVWWQADNVLWTAADRSVVDQRLVKVGNSFDPTQDDE